ncbi:MAG: MlrC C-terminal domain-containing protein, partial [Candidatus Latescibacteria bacterium]|nr:MlrC C-terminal domain-containing protein [Candidatus Latescibacterota bacterium]
TPGVLAVNVFGGFAYSDVPHAGCSVMTVTDGEKSLAQATADDLADEVWRRRHEFAKGLPDAEEAVRAAIAETDGLVVLADTGDNVGGGSPGDGTVLLSELLEQGADGALALLCDPDAVAKAIEAGVTNEVTLSVGGNHDHLHGTPLSVTGTVRLISDGRWINRGEMHDGVSENQGRTAVVDLGGVTLVLTERKHYMWNLEQLRAIGIEPKDQQIIVNKSAIAYRAAYGPIAATMIEVATPGACPVDLSAISYHRIKRPVFPLDAM